MIYLTFLVDNSMLRLNAQVVVYSENKNLLWIITEKAHLVRKCLPDPWIHRFCNPAWFHCLPHRSEKEKYGGAASNKLQNILYSRRLLPAGWHRDLAFF